MMLRSATLKCFISFTISVLAIISFGQTTSAFTISEFAKAQKIERTEANTYISVCDNSKLNFGFVCSVSELEAMLQPLQQQLESITSKYNFLVRSNVELLCEPQLDNWDRWAGYTELEQQINGEKMFGPCLGTYNEDFQSKLHTLFFPCSNPNPRFEEFFPTQYWTGYYDSVDRSQWYGGCSGHYFASDVGLSYKFLDVWRYRWSLIFGSYKNLIIEYAHIVNELKPIISEYEKAKSIPVHNPGDCQWNKSDPTEGFLAKGKTVVDYYGYKFTCKNSKIQRTGRVAFRAAELSCPEYDSPTGNLCSVRTSWGTLLQLNQLPKYQPAGKAINTGWYISISGYRCTIKLYANFAYRESCR